MTKHNTLKIEVGFMEDGERAVETHDNVRLMYKKLSNSDFNETMMVIEYIQINDEIGRTHYWMDELNYIKEADTDFYYFAKTVEDKEC